MQEPREERLEVRESQSADDAFMQRPREGKTFNPDCYVRTGASGLLTLLKAMEGITAVVGLYLVLSECTGLALLDEAIRQLKSAFDTLEASLPYVWETADWVSGLIWFSHAIILADLILILIDAVAAVCLRVGGFGSGVIRFVHTLRSVFLYCAIALLILVGGWLLYTLFSEGSDPNLNAVLSVYSTLYVGATFVGMGLTVAYHNGVAGIMKTLKRERKSGTRQSARKSVLPAESGFFALLWGVSLATLLWLYFRGDAAGSLEKGILDLFGALYVEDLVSADGSFPVAAAAVCAFFFAKHALVAACAGKFNRVHRFAD